MRRQGSRWIRCLPALLYRRQGCAGGQGGVEQQSETRQAITLRRAELRVVGRIPYPGTQGLQGRTVGVEGLLHLVHPRLEGLSLFRVELFPLPTHRARKTQQHQQFLAQAADGPGPLSTTAAFEPGMFALGIHRDNPAQDFQQPFTGLGIARQGRTGSLHAALPGSQGLPGQLPLDPQRPKQGTGCRGADDAQADLGAACHRLIKHPQRMGKGRQGNDRHRVAGQHE